MANFWKKQRQLLSKTLLRRVTQREMGNLLGYTDKLVGLWETDVCAPPIHRAVDIAKHYRISVETVRREISEQAARIREDNRQTREAELAEK